MIEKKAMIDNCHIRRFIYFNKGRQAFYWLLRQLGAHPGQKILLPAYIGWSPREGSGVFDPVSDLELDPVFYHMSPDLTIDCDDFLSKLFNNPVRFALIIHYFGFVDKAYHELIEALINKGVVIIEDSAHALLTDLVGSVCGRLCDASIFSLHKILPVEIGGLLAIRNDSPISPIIRCREGQDLNVLNPWEYDLAEIACIRIRNYKYWIDRLQPYNKMLEPLHPILCNREIPQSLPLLVNSGSRDHLYLRMNELGFGVVSLYHTLIKEIDPRIFQIETALSRHITNFPVHQDVTLESIDSMLKALDGFFTNSGAKM